MAISIKEWILRKLLNGDEEIISQSVSTEFDNLIKETYLREVAFWTCTNRVAGAISKCEFMTFQNHKSVREKEYYLWNIEPNKNQNSTIFLQKLVSKLFKDNEVVIVDINGQLLIADSFDVKKYATLEYEFSNVTVNDYKFDKKFRQSEVIYLVNNFKDVKKMVDKIATGYAELMAYTVQNYKNKTGEKGILTIDSGLLSGGGEKKEKLEDLMNTRFRNYFNAQNAIVPLAKGYSYEKTNKDGSAGSTRDIKDQIDDVFDITARAFGVPPALAKGNVQDTSKAVDELLTFCVDPLADTIQTEINRKRNGFKGFKDGTFLKIKTSSVKHVDIFDVSTSIDKLISSGAFCINDVRILAGQEKIEEGWANEHFITKNYATIEDFLKEVQSEQ